jgi:hypothetical protein
MRSVEVSGINREDNNNFTIIIDRNDGQRLTLDPLHDGGCPARPVYFVGV